ncbi:izumo sperm-egg fusion protein 2-like isoform X1 [Pseudophryne corroboree]|uniref:izumo sperm-egg fusion protein 2-like isoform X1 n=1 Tax=Pseudophryne corroboree TaxID=495146 RepID=UPI0030815DA0
MRSLILFTKRHPWLTNVSIYGSLFATADIVQQRLSKGPNEPIDFKQTAKVGIVGFCFHANFNFFWLRFIERVFPGSAPQNVIRKVACDQLMAAPITISAFYTEIHQFNTLVGKLLKEAQYYLNAKEKDQEYLDAMMNLRKNTTLRLKEALQFYQDKACSESECGWLKLSVFNCIQCMSVPPSCLGHKVCMVDKEPKISLRYNDEKEEGALLKTGLLVVGISAIILFLAFALLTFKYNKNLGLLTESRQKEPI